MKNKTILMAIPIYIILLMLGIWGIRTMSCTSISKQIKSKPVVKSNAFKIMSGEARLGDGAQIDKGGLVGDVALRDQVTAINDNLMLEGKYAEAVTELQKLHTNKTLIISRQERINLSNCLFEAQYQVIYPKLESFTDSKGNVVRLSSGSFLDKKYSNMVQKVMHGSDENTLWNNYSNELKKAISRRERAKSGAF